MKILWVLILFMCFELCFGLYGRGRPCHYPCECHRYPKTPVCAGNYRTFANQCYLDLHNKGFHTGGIYLHKEYDGPCEVPEEEEGGYDKSRIYGQHYGEDPDEKEDDYEVLSETGSDPNNNGHIYNQEQSLASKHGYVKGNYHPFRGQRPQYPGGQYNKPYGNPGAYRPGPIVYISAPNYPPPPDPPTTTAQPTTTTVPTTLILGMPQSLSTPVLALSSADDSSSLIQWIRPNFDPDTTTNTPSTTWDYAAYAKVPTLNPGQNPYGNPYENIYSSTVPPSSTSTVPTLSSSSTASPSSTSTVPTMSSSPAPTTEVPVTYYNPGQYPYGYPYPPPVYNYPLLPTYYETKYPSYSTDIPSSTLPTVSSSPSPTLAERQYVAYSEQYPYGNPYPLPVYNYPQPIYYETQFPSYSTDLPSSTLPTISSSPSPTPAEPQYVAYPEHVSPANPPPIENYPVPVYYELENPPSDTVPPSYNAPTVPYSPTPNIELPKPADYPVQYPYVNPANPPPVENYPVPVYYELENPPSDTVPPSYNAPTIPYSPTPNIELPKPIEYPVQYPNGYPYPPPVENYPVPVYYELENPPSGAVPPGSMVPTVP